MKMAWQLQEAKNKLSQVIDRAVRQGPQTITLRGKPTAIVVSAEDYRKLTRTEAPLSEFFGRSPLKGAALDLKRSKELPRIVEL